MKVTYRILKKFLPDLKITPSELASLLTDQGLVVENIVNALDIFSNKLVAGYIEKVDRKKEYNRCSVNIGDETVLIHVTPWGTPLEGSMVIINVSGEQPSASPLADDRPEDPVPYLVVLPGNWRPGDEVTKALVEDDRVIEFEITANRGDCLSISGLAREVSAKLGIGLKQPNDSFQSSGNRSSFRIDNTDAMNACPYYTGRHIRRVRVRPSSWPVIRDLYLLGMRPVNNIVDYTNLVMIETGQPLHAFDAERLEGNHIIVRQARRGEKLITLDGVERNLDESMLVIADAKKPVALAGIMGGMDSEVTSSTKEILLEAAVFDSVSIRRTARELGLRTEASSRFERGVDPGAALTSSSRVISLLQGENTETEVMEPWLETGSPPERMIDISLSLPLVEEIMSTSLDRDEMKGILQRLGFTVNESEKDMILVRTPSWRMDVYEPIDLVEEIGRVHGYDWINASLPQVEYDPGNPAEEERLEHRIRYFLVDRGMSEIITLSLLGHSTLKKAGYEPHKCVELRNPLTQDYGYLRPNLAISFLDVLRTNVTMGRENLGFFEIGDIFCQNEKGKNNAPFLEEKRLVTVYSGSLAPPLWQRKETKREAFYRLKGLWESFLELTRIHVPESWFSSHEEPDGLCDPEFSFTVYTPQSEPLSWGGLLRREVVDAFDFWGDFYYLEIRLAKLAEMSAIGSFKYKDINRFPSVRRDISIVANRSIQWHTIEKSVRKVVEEKNIELEKMELFDSFHGDPLPKNYCSLSFSVTFRADDRTLTDNEIDCWISILKDRLKSMDEIFLREEYGGN